MNGDPFKVDKTAFSAASLHDEPDEKAYARATADMDIWVAIHAQNAARLAAALKEFGFDLPALTPDLFLQEDKAARMGVPPFRIALMTTISGAAFADCFATRLEYLP